MYYQNQQRKKVLNQVPGPPKIRPSSNHFLENDILAPLQSGIIPGDSSILPVLYIL